METDPITPLPAQPVRETDSHGSLLGSSPATSNPSGRSGPTSTAVNSGSSLLPLKDEESLPLPPKDEDALARREHTIDVQKRVQERYRPYHPRIAPPPLELRFANKAVGDNSFTDLTFEDVVEGRQKFMSGLSHFSDTAIRAAYAAKIASKKCILHRIALSQANIDALEKRNAFFRQLEREANIELDAEEEELETIRNVMGARGISEDAIEFHHAVYADELVALTIGDLQLSQMVDEMRRDNDNDTISVDSEDSDDLVYKDSPQTSAQG